MPDNGKREGHVDRGSAVRWDGEGMTTLYGTVFGIEVSRESISLLFGGRTARRGDSEEAIMVSDRIILSPFAAKRSSVCWRRPWHRIACFTARTRVICARIWRPRTDRSKAWCAGGTRKAVGDYPDSLFLVSDSYRGNCAGSICSCSLRGDGHIGPSGDIGTSAYFY